MSNLRLVAFSGGCDSTLALYEALINQKAWFVGAEKPRPEVRSISVVQPNVPANPQQLRARGRILAEFKRRGLLVEHINVAITQTGGQPRRGNGGSVQAQIWLGAIAPYLADDEDLVLGWHDGEFDNVADAKAAFDALQRINGKTGALAFPLRHRTKPEIVARLRELGLLELCWWCEGCRPGCKCEGRGFIRNGQPCGECKKCIAHETVLWQLKKFGAKALSL